MYKNNMINIIFTIRLSKVFTHIPAGKLFCNIWMSLLMIFNIAVCIAFLSLINLCELSKSVSTITKTVKIEKITFYTVYYKCII